MALTGKFGKECDVYISEAHTLPGAIKLYSCIGTTLSKQSLTRFERQRLTDERKRLYEVFGQAVREERVYNAEMRREPSRYVTIQKPHVPGILMLFFGGSPGDLEINKTISIPVAPSRSEHENTRGIEDVDKREGFIVDDSAVMPHFRQPLAPGQFKYPLSSKLFATELLRRAAQLDAEAASLRKVAANLARDTAPIDDNSRLSHEQKRPTKPGDVLGKPRRDGTQGRVRKERSDVGIPRKK